MVFCIISLLTVKNSTLHIMIDENNDQIRAFGGYVLSILLFIIRTRFKIYADRMME